jgi:bifunctional aspartokinase / homoserine dehydrogenase 1
VASGKLITMKFGGETMQDGDAILQVAEILLQNQQAGHRVIVVVSALPGVTDLLKESISLGSYQRVYQKLLAAHTIIARKLIQDARDRQLLIQDVTDILDSYSWMGRSMVNRAPTPAETDVMTSIGERLGARLLTSHLQHRGVRASAVSAGQLIVTDDKFQAAKPDLEKTRLKVQAKLIPLLEQGLLPIVTGFMGATPEGKITTLGEGGGDLSSAVIAACSDADELWIWRDIDGVMTADPRQVEDAVTIPELSYGEIDTLAYYGVNLPLSKRLLPAIDQDIPISIRNAYKPEHPGTRILSQEQTTSGVIKAVIANKAVRLLQIEGSLNSSPVSSRASAALTKQELKILAVFQNASQLGLVVPPAQFDTAYQALEEEFKFDRDLEVFAENDVALLTVIGANLRIDTAMLGQLHNALTSAGVTPIGFGKGVSNASLPLLIAENDIESATSALHPLTLTRLTHG